MCVRIPKDSTVIKQKSVVLEIHYAVNIASLTIDTQAPYCFKSPCFIYHSFNLKNIHYNPKKKSEIFS